MNEEIDLNADHEFHYGQSLILLDKDGGADGLVYFIGYCIDVDTGRRDGTMRVSRDEKAANRAAFDVPLDRVRPADPANRKQIAQQMRQASRQLNLFGSDGGDA